jgi:DNA-binding IscR family transcriptional regulator
MARSTKLITATFILALVGARAPALMNTDVIAKAIKVNPTRVRHIVSKLVKAGLLRSYRGGRGGLALARPAAEITLREIHDALGQERFLAPQLFNPFARWNEHCFVFSTFEELFARAEERMLAEFEMTTLDRLFAPFHPAGVEIGKAEEPARVEETFGALLRAV